MENDIKYYKNKILEHYFKKIKHIIKTNIGNFLLKIVVYGFTEETKFSYICNF